MAGLWTPLLLAASVAGSTQVSEAEYHSFPRLFLMDDPDACLAAPGALYCLGSFTLTNPEGPPGALLARMQEYSVQSREHFNRTRLHRGTCVSRRCPQLSAVDAPRRFERCVRLHLRRYRLHASLSSLDYCTAAGAAADEPDVADLVFAGVVALLLIMNVVGTVYDLTRNKDHKPYAALTAWSLPDNWRRLTGTHSVGGDPRLSALTPVQGIRAVSLVIVMMAHSVIVYHMAYLYNPEFIEKASSHWSSMMFQNGSLIVQNFFVVSSFLLTYNVLLHVEQASAPGAPLRALPALLLHRVIRITPVNVFWVSLMATWWRRMGSGALWPPLVEAEARRCRGKWWSHALYINNLYRSEEPCLVQTWFLAADMQVYVVCCVASLLLCRARAARALLVLGALLATTMLANFLLAYCWELRPIVLTTSPETIRAQYRHSPSFKWLYTSCWGSLPASLLGQMLAFLYKHTQDAGYNVAQSKWFRSLHWTFVPALVCWTLGGLVPASAGAARLPAAVYAAVDRPVFAAIMAFGMLGMFNKVGNFWWRFASWHGWVVLGRMSLSVLMVHWSYNLTLIAVSTQAARVSIFEISGHWYVTMAMTYLTSVPLHLLLELPARRWLQAALLPQRHNS